MKPLSLYLLLPLLASAASPYRAERVMDHGVESIRLTDARHKAAVSIAPSLGNRAYEFKINGKEILYTPRNAPPNAPRPPLSGIPFLAPWANRIAGGGFWANGQRYPFNPDLGSVRLDPNKIAIHGMLTASPLWQVIELNADEQSASVTSKLSFWKYPELMANWPFAHEYEMTYRLSNGVLDAVTSIRNLSDRPMPLAIGFHPYFQLPGIPRTEWNVHIPARKHVETDSLLVATGAMKPSNLSDRISLRDHTFDDGFTDLVPDSNGQVVVSVEGRDHKIEVLYGPKYHVAVVFAPPLQNFICFEPMTAINNGINLAHEGKYPDLQTIAAGAIWQESFSVRTTGF